MIMIIVSLHNNKFTSTRNSYFYLCMHLLLMLINLFIYLLNAIHQSFLLQNGPGAGFHQRSRSQHDGGGGHCSPPQPPDSAGNKHGSDLGRGSAACSVQRAVGPPGAAGLHRGPGLPSHPRPAAHVHCQAGQCCPGRAGGLP